MNDIRYHPAKLKALQMIGEFKMPRHILAELSPYVAKDIITRAWVEKQSSEAKRAKWCRPLVAQHRQEYFRKTITSCLVFSPVTSSISSAVKSTKISCCPTVIFIYEENII